MSEAVREQADLHKQLEDSEEMRKNKEEDNIKLREELRQSEKDRSVMNNVIVCGLGSSVIVARVMSAHEYTTLRAEVDRMRSEQEKIHKNRRMSDDEISL